MIGWDGPQAALKIINDAAKIFATPENSATAFAELCSSHGSGYEFSLAAEQQLVKKALLPTDRKQGRNIIW